MVDWIAVLTVTWRKENAENELVRFFQPASPSLPSWDCTRLLYPEVYLNLAHIFYFFMTASITNTFFTILFLGGTLYSRNHNIIFQHFHSSLGTAWDAVHFFYIPIAEVPVNSGFLGWLLKQSWISPLLRVRVSCILRLLLLPTRRSVIGSLKIILSSLHSESSSGILLLLPICWTEFDH